MSLIFSKNDMLGTHWGTVGELFFSELRGWILNLTRFAMIVLLAFLLRALFKRRRVLLRECWGTFRNLKETQGIIVCAPPVSDILDYFSAYITLNTLVFFSKH